MTVKCHDCGFPIEVYSDLATGNYQCEACFTLKCPCGSSDFKQISESSNIKIVCECGSVIEENFDDTPVGFSEEALVIIFRTKYLRSFRIFKTNTTK